MRHLICRHFWGRHTCAAKFAGLATALLSDTTSHLFILVDHGMTVEIATGNPELVWCRWTDAISALHGALNINPNIAIRLTLM